MKSLQSTPHCTLNPASPHPPPPGKKDKRNRILKEKRQLIIFNMRVDYYIKILESKIVTRESGKFSKIAALHYFTKDLRLRLKYFNFPVVFAMFIFRMSLLSFSFFSIKQSVRRLKNHTKL